MVVSPTMGPGLEARIQRVFMAQGVFAERGLCPSASPSHRMLATDIDVLTSEYVSGFHLTRRHAECKGGKIPLLDRILWLNGVRSLLGADGSYLILSDFDKDASDFALSLEIHLIIFSQLGAWESSISIPHDAWPCRSDFATYDSALVAWTRLSGASDSDAYWRFLREVSAFIKIDSWLSFRYRYLNRLFRFMDGLSKQYDRMHSNRDQTLCARYCFSGLIVRLSQYLLSICSDVTRLPATDVKAYLTQHFTYGDQDPERTSALIKSIVDWVKHGLEKKGIPLPTDIDPSRLFEAPAYTPDLLELIDRLLQQGDEARYLTIAVEAMQFSTPTTVSKFPKLLAAATAGSNLAALVKGFAIRAFSTPTELAEPVDEGLKAAYHLTPPETTRGRKSGKGQLSFQA